MPWPLGGTKSTVDIEVVNLPNPIPVIDLDMTHTTRFSNEFWGAIKFPHKRTVDLEVVPPGYNAIIDMVFDMEADLIHHFAGIGGGLYIPSFPQLDRRNTSWPHAT